MRAGRVSPEGLDAAIDEALARLEHEAGRRLGDPGDPLLVSVRSGARDSMPGMMDTVLNLGLNDESVEGLARATGNERFAWDSYRRLVQMFGNVVRGVSGERFESEIARLKAERGVRLDTELDTDALRELTRRFKALYRFPPEPRAQLREAVLAVFDSWMGDRAVAYRQINGIPEEWGTAVNVQRMVYGNRGPTSASGVAFSRDEVTGAPEPSGDFLVDAQGEDVVSGVRTPRDLGELAEWMPAAHAELMEILRTLERHYKDLQDTEFTIEQGRLYMLQTRSAKRPAQAAVRFAVDAVRKACSTPAEAMETIDAGALDALLHPTFDPAVDYEVIARGVAASPGRGQGRHRVHRRGGRRGGRGGPRRRPGPAVHRGRRRRRLPRREGHPDLRGRQGLACGAGGPGHGPAGRHGRRRGPGGPPRPRGPHRRSHPARRRPDLHRRRHGGDHPRRRPAGHPGVDERFETRAALGRRAPHAAACGPTPTRPADAQRARRFGAEGIGLCRTEHMFMAADRQPKMQRMIMAADEAEPARGARRAAAAPAGRLRGPLRGDGRAARSRSACSTPRCTSSSRTASSSSSASPRRGSTGSQELAALEQQLERARALEEGNPMLGTRGVRLGLLHPEIYEMQARADLPGRASGPRPHRRGADAGDHDPPRRLRRASSSWPGRWCSGWAPRRASARTTSASAR